jgi:hypothetical protein
MRLIKEVTSTRAYGGQNGINRVRYSIERLQAGSSFYGIWKGN